MPQRMTAEVREAGGSRVWKKLRNPLLFGLVLFLLLRCSLAALAFRNPDGGVLVDSRGYLWLAESLRQSGRYVADEGTDLSWPPGYPVFINLVFGTLGEQPPFVALSQLLLSGATALLLYRIGKNAGSPQAGMAAAWLYAINPNAAFWSLTVMSETLFGFLIVAALLSWLASSEGNRLGPMVLAGCLLGLATLVRPLALYLSLLWAVFTFVRFRRMAGHRRAILTATALILPVVLPVSLWSLRNQMAHEKFVFSTVGGHTMLNYNVALVLADVRGITRDEAMKEISEWDDERREAIEIIAAHPGAFVKVQVQGILKTLLGFDLGVWGRIAGIDESLRGYGITQSILGGKIADAVASVRQMTQDPGTRSLAVLLGLSLLQLAAVYGFALYALIPPLRRKLPLTPWLALSLITAAYLVVIPLASGTARFRIPVEPFLTLFAGAGLLRLLSRRQTCDDGVTATGS